MTRYIALACILLACGCCNCPKAGPGGGAALRRNPPTQPMEAIVNAINANNERIPSLWATLNYSATIRDEHGQAHSVTSDDGVMLYQRPDKFRLVGKKEFVGTVFDIGTNGRQFWLEVVPGTNRMWWGNFEDLRRLDLGRLPIPIRPDLVLEVLGVSTIPTNFAASTVIPIMRYDSAADAYAFLFSVRAPDRWLAQKEVWYDRATLRPRRVVLYDRDGRPVLQAQLAKDTRVQVPDEPPANWPLVAGDYKLFFPDSGSSMEFTLKDVRLYKAMSTGVRIPNAAASFRLPDVQGTDVRAVQIGGGGGGI